MHSYLLPLCLHSWQVHTENLSRPPNEPEKHQRVHGTFVQPFSAGQASYWRHQSQCDWDDGRRGGHGEERLWHALSMKAVALFWYGIMLYGGNLCVWGGGVESWHTRQHKGTGSLYFFYRYLNTALSLPYHAFVNSFSPTGPPSEVTSSISFLNFWYCKVKIPFEFFFFWDELMPATKTTFKRNLHSTIQERSLEILLDKPGFRMNGLQGKL